MPTLAMRLAALEAKYAPNVPALRLVFTRATEHLGRRVLSIDVDGCGLVQNDDESDHAFRERAAHALREGPGQTVVVLDEGDLAA